MIGAAWSEDFWRQGFEGQSGDGDRRRMQQTATPGDPGKQKPGEKEVGHQKSTLGCVSCDGDCHSGFL